MLSSRANFIEMIKQSLVPAEKLTAVPSSYAILQAACVARELEIEATRLLRLFLDESLNDEDLKNYFKLFCLEREKSNQSTYLSYFALPQSACNLLYWNIALGLFQPKNLAEMIAILLPSLKSVLQVDVGLMPRDRSTKQDKFERTRLNMTAQDCMSLLSGLPCEYANLQYFIVDNNICLNVKSITHLSLTLHYQLYDLLTAYPCIKAKLYAHNNDWQHLQFNLENGIAPREAIRSLIFHLKRSGTKYTNNEFAASPALIAVANFRHYLNQLPQEFYEKLLALNHNEYSLAKVLSFLNQGGCVETAAARLEEILTDPGSQGMLNELPLANQQARQQMEEKYLQINKGTGLSAMGFDSSVTLPSEIKKCVLADIELNTVSDFVDLVLYLPPHEYEYLFAHAKLKNINPECLAATMEMITPEQRDAFVYAWIKHLNRVGGLKMLFFFAAYCGDFTIIQKALNHYSYPDCVRAIMQEYPACNLMLSALIKTERGLTMLVSIFKLLDDELREQLLFNNNLMHIFQASRWTNLLSTLLNAKHYQCLKELIASFAITNRSSILMGDIFFGPVLITMLHGDRELNFETICDFLELLSPDDCNTLVKSADMDNQTLLDVIKQQENMQLHQQLTHYLRINLQVVVFKKIYDQIYLKTACQEPYFLLGKENYSTSAWHQSIQDICNTVSDDSIIVKAWQLTLNHVKRFDTKPETVLKHAMQEYIAQQGKKRKTYDGYTMGLFNTPYKRQKQDEMMMEEGQSNKYISR